MASRSSAAPEKPTLFGPSKCAGLSPLSTPCWASQKTNQRIMSSHHQHNCLDHAPAHSSVQQSLDELNFERGIWPAALDGDLKKVTELLNKQVSWVHRPDNAGYTALHYAAKAGHLDVCQLLIRRGADVNAVTKAGLASPLHRAAMCGKHSICELLLKSGADVNLQDADGNSALSRANGHHKVAELLIEHGAT
ncbi:ankyrin repeat domain-containing protein 39-like [Cloeon dipterum]|uniref:ankyrin repeat domain-containing protein 39-like n=1 Tax=Cloeon dipterum TaxID=197152 RepID=UPI00321FC7F8